MSSQQQDSKRKPAGAVYAELTGHYREIGSAAILAALAIKMKQVENEPRRTSATRRAA